MKPDSPQPPKLSIATSGIGEYSDGYMSNIALDVDAATQVSALQQKIGHAFSKGVWFQPEDSLHITLFDFIAPKVEYDVPRRELFRQQHETIFDTMAQLAVESHTFTITLQSIHVSQSAIYLQGKDDGSVRAIRDRFTELYDLDERTKKPPAIIHSTIGRFTNAADIHDLNEYIQEMEVNIDVPVKHLRLVHERRLPMLDYEILDTWKLRK